MAVSSFLRAAFGDFGSTSEEVSGLLAPPRVPGDSLPAEIMSSVEERVPSRDDESRGEVK